MSVQRGPQVTPNNISSKRQHSAAQLPLGCYFWLDPRVTKTEQRELMNTLKKEQL